LIFGSCRCRAPPSGCRRHMEKKHRLLRDFLSVGIGEILQPKSSTPVTACPWYRAAAASETKPAVLRSAPRPALPRRSECQAAPYRNQARDKWRRDIRPASGPSTSPRPRPRRTSARRRCVLVAHIISAGVAVAFFARKDDKMAGCNAAARCCATGSFANSGLSCAFS